MHVLGEAHPQPAVVVVGAEDLRGLPDGVVAAVLPVDPGDRGEPVAAERPAYSEVDRVLGGPAGPRARRRCGPAAGTGPGRIRAGVTAGVGAAVVVRLGQRDPDAVAVLAPAVLAVGRDRRKSRRTRPGSVPRPARSTRRTGRRSRRRGTCRGPARTAGAATRPWLSRRITISLPRQSTATPGWSVTRGWCGSRAVPHGSAGGTGLTSRPQATPYPCRQRLRSRSFSTKYACSRWKSQAASICPWK